MTEQEKLEKFNDFNDKSLKRIVCSLRQHFGYNPVCDFEDMMQEARIVVWTDALPNFDPSKGCSFDTFAELKIRRQLVNVYRATLKPIDMVSTDIIREDFAENGWELPYANGRTAEDEAISEINNNMFTEELDRMANSKRKTHRIGARVIRSELNGSHADTEGKEPTYVNMCVKRAREELASLKKCV